MNQNSNTNQIMVPSAEQKIHDAVFVLASLEILDALIASKNTSSLQMSDYAAHKDFQRKLIQTKEQIPDITANGGALQVAGQQLNTLSRSLNKIADEIQSIDSECLRFRTDQDNQFHHRLFEDGTTSYLMAEGCLGATQGPKPNPDATNAWIKSIDITGIKTSVQDAQAWVETLTRDIQDGQSAHQKLKEKLESLIKAIRNTFNGFYNAVTPKSLTGSETELSEHSSASPTEVDILVFSDPPKLEKLKIGVSISLYLNLAEDISSGAIAFPTLDTKSAANSYSKFMSALLRCDESLKLLPSAATNLKQFTVNIEDLSQFLDGESIHRTVENTLKSLKQEWQDDQGRLTSASKEAVSGDLAKAIKNVKELRATTRFNLDYKETESTIRQQLAERDRQQLANATKEAASGDLAKAIKSVKELRAASQSELDYKEVDSLIAQRLAQRDRKQLANAIAQATLGNIAAAKKIIDKLRNASQGNLDFNEIETALAKQLATYSKIEDAYNQVIEEHGRLDTKFRRFWGEGLGNSYKGLEQRLKEMNVLVQQVPWAMGSELSKQMAELVTKVRPCCDLVQVAFTWGKVSIEQLLTNLKVQRVNPETAFVNALCAVAAADGDFCSTEQLSVKDMCKSSLTQITEQKIEETIDAWTKIARSKGMAPYIAQSIVNIDNLKGTEYDKMLLNCLMEIVKADGTKQKWESSVYNAMLAKLGS